MGKDIFVGMGVVVGAAVVVVLAFTMGKRSNAPVAPVAPPADIQDFDNQAEAPQKGGADMKDTAGGQAAQPAQEKTPQPGSPPPTTQGTPLPSSPPPTQPTPVNPASGVVPQETTSEPAGVTRGVYFNGRQLTEGDLAGITNTYGVTVDPGNYWYDSVSGLYGNIGEGSAGFMLPGHTFAGLLAANASGGNSGVYFNGRELTATEIAIVESIIQTQAIPGRYFFDVYGNVGVEGTGIPLVNLYTAGGTSGGGDNFWTSRFSAGNYYTDASGAPSQGYVSVPGYGPVGYGF